MRSETEIKNLILDTAFNDDRIRAVLLNGSRANSKIKPDNYQDFDIVFIVNSFDGFINNHDWITIFGEKIIWQLPEEMNFGKEELLIDLSFGFHYLMLFKDLNRIDLTIFPIENFKTYFKLDSLTVIWLDKDNIFSKIKQPDDSDYHIHKPTMKEFIDTCNEFWWVSTYVAKGLLRNEITYTKEMLETVVRPMFMKIIEWKIGSENNFSVSFGKAGKFINKYLTKYDYEKILKTYSDYEIENNWQSLFCMTEIFGQFAIELSEKLNFNYNIIEQRNTIDYLKKLHSEQKNYR